MIFLDLEDLLHVAERAVGAPVEVRDIGLLESAAARPRSSAFGTDAYPTLHDKAAALLHSIVRNHALVDGNTRLGLAAVIVFYGVNGRRLTLTNDEAYDVVMAVATANVEDVARIAQLSALGSEGV